MQSYPVISLSAQPLRISQKSEEDVHHHRYMISVEAPHSHSCSSTRNKDQNAKTGANSEASRKLSRKSAICMCDVLEPFRIAKYVGSYREERGTRIGFSRYQVKHSCEGVPHDKFDLSPRSRIVWVSWAIKPS